MFLAPALLGFLALASAPVIIHLLNRRQFDRVEWAPMKVLKLTVKQNRRRVQLEHWLLLAIRTLAVVALILAIARPLSAGRNVAGLFDLPGRAARVLLLDDSLSMTAVGGGTTPWQQAITAAGEVLEQAGSGDEISIVLAARGETVVRQVDLETAQQTLAELKAREPSHGAADWPEAVATADDLLRSSSLSVQDAVVISDLQSPDAEAVLAEIDSAWDERTIAIVDVAVPRGDNRAAAAIDQVDPIVIAGSDALISAVVISQTSASESGVQAELLVNDRSETLALPDLPAAGEVRVPLTRSFPEGGTQRLEVRLPDDSLPADNRTYAITEVRPQLEVVTVDGDIRPGPFESESDFVALSMQAGYSRVNITRLTPADWSIEPIETADLIVLANVGDLPSERIPQLERLVRGGTGLMVFPGDAVDPEATNGLLHKKGSGLLPAAYGESVAAEFAGLVVTDLADSPIAALQRLTEAAFADVRPKRIFPLLLPESTEAVVLGKWNDGDQTPVAISQRVGSGRVVQWSVAADRDGSNWPTQPSFVLAMRSAALSLARPTDVQANVVAGEPLRLRFSDGVRPEAVKLKRPDAEQPIDPELAGDRESVTYAVTDRAGFYKMTWTRSDGGASEQLFAVRPDATESLDQPLDREAYLASLEQRGIRFVAFGSTATGPQDEATELWPWAIAAMLGLLLMDTALSTYVDRKRRPLRGPAVTTGVTA